MIVLTLAAVASTIQPFIADRKPSVRGATRPMADMRST